MVMMLAPPGLSVGSSVKVLSGGTYTVDSNFLVSVTSQFDAVNLKGMGFDQVQPGGRNNFGSTVDPTTGDDNTADYAPGSLWTNTTASPQRAWINLSAATAAAVWLQISAGGLIATAGSADFANLTLTAMLTNSAATAVTPFSGGGQASATALTLIFNNISSSVASSAPYDSAKLVASAAGLAQIAYNSSSHPVQLFGTGSDTITLEGTTFAAGTGITMPASSLFIGNCLVAGNWIGFLLCPNVGLGGGLTSNTAYNTNTATAGTTLTGANVTGGIIEVTLNMTGTMGGDSNAQLPTASNLFAAIPNPIVGVKYRLRVINSSSANHVWTITTNTGWTLNGTMTIAQNTWRDFYLALAASTTATLQNIGTGTFS
jgi:hypothetical protein